MTVLKGYLQWGAVLLVVILLVLTMGATFAANQKEINATKSANITNATTNIATLRHLTITTNVSGIKNLTISINLPKLKNETKKMINTTAVAAIPMNPTSATANGTESQNIDSSSGGCPCNSQG